MHSELDLQKKYLQDQTIETIYLGGGTPSLIGAEEVQKLIDKITQNHVVSSHAEII